MWDKSHTLQLVQIRNSRAEGGVEPREEEEAGTRGQLGSRSTTGRLRRAWREAKEEMNQGKADYEKSKKKKEERAGGRGSLSLGYYLPTFPLFF